MNFTAHGYAELTRMLKADIAVLEGGYAIEGALPYVNLGIILAMAGMDYSHVREPNYDPERLRQSESVSTTIAKICQLVRAYWDQRGAIAAEVRAKPGGDKRSRQIFYDTDGIHETQEERIQLCADCGGALRIDSRSDRGRRILAIHIPRKACPRCQAQGRDWFEQADTEQYPLVALQDRTTDTYTVRST
jgi:hypothetical protein